MLDGVYARYRHLVPEIVKFCVVGGLGAIIDLGGTAALHGPGGLGPLTAKAIAVGVATAVTYTGSRFWTFKGRENQPLLRGASLFVVLNLIGLLIAELVIAITTYGLGYHDQIAYNVASVIGTGLGTIFRYFAYKRWVFLKPAIPNEPLAPVFIPAPEPGQAPGSVQKNN